MNVQKVSLWKKIWEKLIGDFLKNDSFGLVFYSPNVLIDDIRTEIIENSLQNKENREYFFLKICHYLKKDEIVKENISIQFEILRTIFKSGRNGYILEVCNELKNIFKSGIYFNGALIKIIELLEIEEPVNKSYIERITYLTQGLIIEFIMKGYTYDEVKNFPRNILDDAKIDGKFNRVYTNYPHGLDPSKYMSKKGVFNQKKFDKDVINLVNSITMLQRLNRLSYYYEKGKKGVTYIFLIEGLKIEEELVVKDILFYNPKCKKFIDKNDENAEWEFLQDKEDEFRFTQAAVEIEMLTPQSSLSEAITKLNNTLSILTCYFNTKTPLKISNSKYLVLEDGKCIWTSSVRDENDKFFKHHNSFSLEGYDHIYNMVNESYFCSKENVNTKSVNRLNSALHWYRKGAESLNNEEKILNYWIALEHLFNVMEGSAFDILSTNERSKFHLIQEIISSNEILHFVFNFGWELYHHYSSKVNSFSHSDFVLPEDLVKRACLDPKVGEIIVLRDFINCLNEIGEYEKNEYYLNKLSNVLEFYNDNKVTQSIIDDKVNQIKGEILMIYRFRNLIVHNAHYENNLLPYYVWRAKRLVGNLLRRIIRVFSKNKDISDSMILIYLKKEEFFVELKNNRVDLFLSRL